MAEQEHDRSEPATPFKLEEAKKKGTVAKSLDVTSFVVVSVISIAVMAFGLWMKTGLMSAARRAFEVSALPGTSLSAASELLRLGFFLLSPVLAFAVLAAVLGNIVQSRPTFTTFPLKPDFSRLNPAQGFKRLFSMRVLFEALKSVVKLLLFVAAGWIVIKAIAIRAGELPVIGMPSLAAFLQSEFQVLLFALMLVLLLVAAFDFRFTLWEFAKKMRMSRRELKDEFKRREGDPQIRAKRREHQKALRKKLGSVQRVKDADVVVTNPAHLAVALKYDSKSMHAPQVLCKGADEVAARIREEAYRHGVPVVQNIRLARLLFRKVEIDAFVPEESYPAVAAVLHALYRSSRRDS